MESFSHPLVRDLAWLIGGPSLMAAGTLGLDVPPADRMQQLKDEAQPWLAELERQPADLEHWMARRHSPRLGHHAEALMEFWLQHAPGIRFIAGRQILTDGRRTLGDLDLLFDDEVRGVRVHWEMAVKFYLQATPASAWTEWIGPDARDSLDLKLRRIIDQQLPLGRHPLASIGADQPVRSEAFLRGWLFAPASTQEFRPLGSAPNHARGWWLRYGEQTIPAASRASRFAILPRLAWMPPARLAPGTSSPISGSELAQQLDQHFGQVSHLSHLSRLSHLNLRPAVANSVLIAEVQRDAAGWWAEVARGFVVHAQWPGQKNV